MGYVARRGDPKFLSVQSFRTNEGIYLRVVSRMTHGWDPIVSISYSNTSLKELQIDENVFTKADSKIFLFMFDAEASNVTNRTTLDVNFFSGEKESITGHFDTPELDLSYGDLQFEDRLGDGNASNLYNFNSTIYHTSSTLKNSLRTFVYPAKSLGPSTLSPVNTAGQYYISSSSTALYIANSELQNSYYRSISTASTGHDSFGYFLGGPKSQKMYFECSMGARINNVNIIKGYIHAFNLIKIEEASPVYEVCTLRNSSNYYRDSPYSACDGTSLTLDIINDSSNVFVSGGCCDITPEKTSFNVRHTTQNPEVNDTDGGSLLLNWGGGVPPYTVVFVCPPGDAGCTAVAAAANTALASTTDTAYTLSGLSGSVAGEEYSYGVTDSDNNIVVGEAFIPAISSRSTRYACKNSIALNYDTSTAALPDNSKCRWCDATTGKTFKNNSGVHTSEELSDSYSYTVTSNPDHAESTTGDVELIVAVGDGDPALSTYDDWFEGTGTEKIRVASRRLTKSTYLSYLNGTVTLQNAWITANSGTNDTTVYKSSTDEGNLNLSFSSVVPGIYIFKIYYEDSLLNSNMDECEHYFLKIVKGKVCGNSGASNYFDSGVSWISDYNGTFDQVEDLTISDPMLCTYNADIETSVTSALNLTIAYQTNGTNVCEFLGNLNWNGNEFNYNSLAYLILDTVANTVGLAISLISITEVTISVNYNTFEGNTFTSGTNTFTLVGNVIPYEETLLTFSTTSANVLTEIGITSAEMDITVNIAGVPHELTLVWPTTTSLSLATIESETIVDASGDILCAGCFNADAYVTGCTDETACNYNYLATVDDSSCFPMSIVTSSVSSTEVTVDIDGTEFTGNPCGCINSGFLEYDPVAYWAAVMYNGGASFGANPQCGDPIVSGCMDSNYAGYNPNANIHDQDSCGSILEYACTDEEACNYNSHPDVTHQEELCVYEAQGCEDLQGWVISQYNPPNSCNETETADGVLVLSNPTYTGPLYIGGINNIFMGSVGNEAAYLSGIDNSGAFTFVDTNAYVNSLGSMTAFQHPSLGTNITFTGLSSGSFSVFLAASSSADPVTVNDLKYDGACACGVDSAIDATDYDYIEAVGDVSTYDGFTGTTGTEFTITALGGTRANGDTGPCGCMDQMSGSYSETAVVHTPALCNYYGCTDPEASNYLPGATSPCDTPSEQAYGGYPCSPCVYGVPSNLYTAAFCMPSNVTQQLNVIRKCIGTAGTSSYINTITGKNDCTFKEAWKLILIEYLLSKKGLDCVYNCADSVTPDLGTLKSCASRVVDTTTYVSHLASNLEKADSSTFNSFYVGDVVKFKVSIKSKEYMYTLIALPKNHTDSYLKIHHPDYYTGAPLDNDAIQLSPGSASGSKYWKICEEPPSKPSSVDYLGKFITFVQNFCRQCQLPSSKVVSSQEGQPLDSVITVNGIILTINNSELK